MLCMNPMAPIARCFHAGRGLLPQTNIDAGETGALSLYPHPDKFLYRAEQCKSRKSCCSRLALGTASICPEYGELAQEWLSGKPLVGQIQSVPD